MPMLVVSWEMLPALATERRGNAHLNEPSVLVCFTLDGEPKPWTAELVRIQLRALKDFGDRVRTPEELRSLVPHSIQSCRWLRFQEMVPFAVRRHRHRPYLAG